MIESEPTIHCNTCGERVTISSKEECRQCGAGWPKNLPSSDTAKAAAKARTNKILREQIKIRQYVEEKKEESERNQGLD